MGIIDEKGRLFGKINIIDFLLVLFLICIMPVFYFGYKIMTKRPEVVKLEKEFVPIERNCQLVKVKPEILPLISVGDKELDENGQVIGEIVRLGEQSSYQYKFDIGLAEEIAMEDNILEQIEAKLKLKAEVKGNKLYYKDKLIRINSPFEFKTDNYVLTAIPFEEEVRLVKLVKRIPVRIDCQLIRLKPEVLKLISVGDKELDENEEVIGEIARLGKSEPYKQKFDIGKGQEIIEETADFKQLKAKLKLNAEVKESNIYYKDKLIRINSPFEFKTNNYVLTAIPLEKIRVKIVERIVEKIVDLYVTLKELDEDTLKKISVGDKEMDERGEVIAEILSLGKIENSSIEFNLGSGTFVEGQESAKKQISTKMRLRCLEKDGSQFYFKGREMKHRIAFEFKTDKYKAKALLAKTFELVSPLKEKWLSLQVKLSGTAPEIAGILRKGDIEKDAFDKTVARIDSIISSEPAQVLTLKEDEFITLNHPFNKDILIALDVLCVAKEGTYYFKNYPVKIGNNIVFASDLYCASGTIVGLEIK